jgi:hypothetical protein
MADLGAAGGPDIKGASSAYSVCLPASPQDLPGEANVTVAALAAACPPPSTSHCGLVPARPAAGIRPEPGRMPRGGFGDLERYLPGRLDQLLEGGQRLRHRALALRASPRLPWRDHPDSYTCRTRRALSSPVSRGDSSRQRKDDMRMNGNPRPLGCRLLTDGRRLSRRCDASLTRRRLSRVGRSDQTRCGRWL